MDKDQIALIANGYEFDMATGIRQLAMSVLALSDLVASLTPTMDAGATVPEPTIEQLLNVKLASVLAKSGYTTTQSLRNATDEQLLQIPGTSSKTISLIREKVG